MKDIIKWLLQVKKGRARTYSKASEFFSHDKKLADLLNYLAVIQITQIYTKR